jgi:hypothetical protein
MLCSAASLICIVVSVGPAASPSIPTAELRDPLEGELEEDLVDPLEGQLDGDASAEPEPLGDAATEPAAIPPPELLVASTRRRQLEPGDSMSFAVRARPQPGTAVSVTARSLPAGASFVPAASIDEYTFTWSTGDADLGAHVVTFVATDGRSAVSESVELVVREEWEAFLVPGAHYLYYRPAGHARLGAFHGVSLELALVTWVYRNERHGPSHGRINARMELAFSDRDRVHELSSYALGFELSFERDPGRRFLVPFFGVDLGGLYQQRVGHVLVTEPRLGVLLWSSRRLQASVSGAYVLPGSHLASLRGYRLLAGALVNLW